MPNPAFIVEGLQEQNIIRRLCPNSRTVLLGINGNAVEIEQIARRVATLFRLFNNRHYPIFLIFDREKRSRTHDELLILLTNELSKLDIPEDQFVIGIPDNKIECWIMPFIGEDGTILPEASQSYDGINCVGELEKRIKNSGVDYHKTTTGVQLFCSINPSSLANVSDSFKSFHSRARSHCSWLNMFV
ncbi:MAG: hypothetical protein ROO70_19590 [Labrenzia sp.]